MTASVLTVYQQLSEIDSVSSVVVTDIVDDGTSTGTWVRSIRFFGSAVTGSPAVLEVRIKSTTQANLEITTPTLEF